MSISLRHRHDYSEDENRRIDEIVLSTGNVNKPYVVRDIVFASEKLEVDLFDPIVDPNDLLKNISYRLREKAYSYGASAVINCHFEHDHVVHPDGTIFLEIFAYGTVVQYTQSTIGG
ncbi:heavy metal-binding domain-containing protein [Enterococcus bulliens]